MNENITEPNNTNEEIFEESVEPTAAETAEKSDVIEDFEENKTNECACAGDSVRSEFETELENYLPTAENTDKIRKPIPAWVWSMAASAAVCTVLLTVYSLTVIPKLKPTAVISYAETASEGVPRVEDTSSISGINANISPSIVSVETKSSYRNFFGISSSTSTGSGVILSSDGYILTSSSLVGNDGETSVILSDKSEYDAKLVGADENKDIAILKIDASELSAVTLGNSDSVRAGDTAIVIGNVLGKDLGTSITKGIICGVNNGVALQNGGTINLLQTDAITNSNNAGGCLLNSDGHLVGMITYAVSANVENISFAIPSNDIKNLSQSLINTGEAPESIVIGITGLDSDHGILVETVSENSAAAKAGIKSNDLILKADDKPVTSVAELNKIRDTHVKGDTIKLTIYRGGEIIDIDVIL